MKSIIPCLLAGLFCLTTFADTDRDYKKLNKAFASAVEKADEKLDEARKERDKKVKDYIKKYIANLKKIMDAYTKDAKLDKAIEVRNKIEEMEKLLDAGEPKIKTVKKEKTESKNNRNVDLDPGKASSWTAPAGGSISDKGIELSLKGSGIGPAGEALAIFQEELGDSYSISGQIMVTGPYGGFAFNYDQDTKNHCSLYSGGNMSYSYIHAGLTTRSRYISDIPILWKRGEWLKFSLEKKGNKVEVNLDGQKYILVLQDSLKGNYWGLLVHQATEVKVKNVKISN